MYVPRGAQIWPHGQSMQMASAPGYAGGVGTGGGDTAPINIYGGGLGEVVMAYIRSEVASQGGDVQAVRGCNEQELPWLCRPSPPFTSAGSPASSHTAVAPTTTRTNLWVPAIHTAIPALDPTPQKMYMLEAGGIISTTGTPTIIFNPTWGQSATPASNIALGATTTFTLGTLTNASWYAYFKGRIPAGRHRRVGLHHHRQRVRDRVRCGRCGQPNRGHGRHRGDDRRPHHRAGHGPGRHVGDRFGVEHDHRPVVEPRALVN